MPIRAHMNGAVITSSWGRGPAFCPLGNDLQRCFRHHQNTAKLEFIMIYRCFLIWFYQKEINFHIFTIVLVSSFKMMPKGQNIFILVSRLYKKAFIIFIKIILRLFYTMHRHAAIHKAFLLLFP